MAELKMRAGILGSWEDELGVSLEAAFLPVEWRVTILGGSEPWLTVTIEMQNRRMTRLFPSRSTDGIVEFLQHVDREVGSSP